MNTEYSEMPTMPNPTGHDIRTKGESLSHWRGFTKYRYPDGRFYAVSDNDHVLGPCLNGTGCDKKIADFYWRAANPKA